MSPKAHVLMGFSLAVQYVFVSLDKYMGVSSFTALEILCHVSVLPLCVLPPAVPSDPLCNFVFSKIPVIRLVQNICFLDQLLFT